MCSWAALDYGSSALCHFRSMWSDTQRYKFVVITASTECSVTMSMPCLEEKILRIFFSVKCIHIKMF